MKTLKTIFGMALALIALIGARAGFAQTIVGSEHDFSAELWNTFDYAPPYDKIGEGNSQICKVCHTPHNAYAYVPLWNHAVSIAAYTVYSNLISPTFQGGPADNPPSGTSKLCLSCHDGTVALDNYQPVNTSTTFIPPGDPHNLGTDLTNDHPVSFVYNTALATLDGGLFDPSTQPSGLGGTIDADMLDGSDKVQCASCHNPHDPTFGKFLRKSNTLSGLCLTCHDK